MSNNDVDEILKRVDEVCASGAKHFVAIVFELRFHPSRFPVVDSKETRFGTKRR